MEIIYSLFLSLFLNAAEPVIINGFDYQNTSIVKIYTGRSMCSGTVVGPNTIITAGHCGDTGDESSAVVGSQLVKGKFFQSEKYNQGNDIAIVITASKIETMFVSLWMSWNVKPRGRVFISGFGCTDSNRSGSGILRGAYSEIIKDGDSEHFQTVDKYALCFGDSGGPAMVWGSLVGVNSRGNIINRSYFTRINSKNSRDFFDLIIKKEKALICGINLAC